MSEPVKSRIHQGRNSYCPPTKLSEGNVFTGLCVSVHMGSPFDHYPWCIGPHCAAPPPRHKTWGPPIPVLPPQDMRPGNPSHTPTPSSPTSDIWWPLLETCSNLYIRPHCTATPPPRETTGSCLRNYGQRKRAVRILLECFLVLNCANFTLTFIMGNDT